MKKLYVIADMRDKDGVFVTDPIILDNDVQASIAFADYQKNLIKNHVKIDDLRLYKCGEFDNDDFISPVHTMALEEIAVNLVAGEETNE